MSILMMILKIKHTQIVAPSNHLRPLHNSLQKNFDNEED